MLDTIDNPFLQAPTTLRPCIWLLGLFFLVSSCSINIIPQTFLSCSESLHHTLVWFPCSHLILASVFLLRSLGYLLPRLQGLTSFAFLTWLVSEPLHCSRFSNSLLCLPSIGVRLSVSTFCCFYSNISITVFRFLLQLLKGFPVFIFPSLLAHITGLALPTVTTIVATYLYWITYCTVYFIF